MTDDTVAQSRQTDETAARVRLASGPLAGPVLCRVVSMVVARANWPIDRLDDAMLACDVLCAHAHNYASDGRLTLDVCVSSRTLELRVRELAPGGAAALVRDAELPGLGNVLEHVSKSLSIEPDLQSGGSQLVLVISAS
jgi:hypothetical protein